MGLVLDQSRRSHLRQRRHLRHQGSRAVRGSGVGKEALQGLTSSGFRALLSGRKSIVKLLNLFGGCEGTVTLVSVGAWKDRWGEHRNGVVQGPPLPSGDHQPWRV